MLRAENSFLETRKQALRALYLQPRVEKHNLAAIRPTFKFAQVCPAAPVCPGTGTPCTAGQPCQAPLPPGPPSPRRLAAVFRTGGNPRLDNVPGAQFIRCPDPTKCPATPFCPNTITPCTPNAPCGGPPQPPPAPPQPLPPPPPQPPYPPRKRRRSGPKQHELRNEKRLRNQHDQQHAKEPDKAKERQTEDDSQTGSEKASEDASEEAKQRSGQPVVAGRRCHKDDQCDDGRSCPSRGRCTGDGRECDVDHPCKRRRGWRLRAPLSS
ncbi:hypothetical protein HPB51_010177 [Rhipicephalus microplus]|uniref:Uncharacterized protein n=1 Tax=Rhipicephalus microplus TaxID=6941 RepID=A0A9J6F245_RHIMP|nr:hypothetical protein HPB51_010177 [Rhipicephalus microplus]